MRCAPATTRGSIANSASEPGRAAGQYHFRSNYTRERDNSGALFGQDVASFLLGIPTGGSLDINAERLNDTWYHGVFVQDDWKITDRLTLNLGLRYEYEAPTIDSQNRNVRGFDPSAAVSIEAAARAAYAASPIPEIPASQFAVRGGLQFTSDSNRGFYDVDADNIQPRAGFAYALSPKTVLRGGVGIYAVPNIIFGNYPAGVFVVAADRAVAGQRPDVPRQPDRSVSRRRGAAGRRRRGRRHVPGTHA